VTAEEICTRTL